jgi:hypothetical protein
LLPLTPRRRRRMPAIQSTPTPAVRTQPPDVSIERHQPVPPAGLQQSDVDSGLCTMRFLKASGQPAPAGTTLITSGRSWAAARAPTRGRRAARPSRGLLATMLHPWVQTLQQLELGSAMPAPPTEVGNIWGVRGVGGRHWSANAASCRRIVIGAPPSARSVVQICFIWGSVHDLANPCKKHFVLFCSVPSSSWKAVDARKRHA